MNYFTKKIAFTVAMIATIIASSQMALSAQDVVMDENGQYIRSSSGACVRTIWSVGSDKCGRAAPVSNYRAPSVLSKIQQLSRSFIVFFDFNGASLTGDAKQVVGDIYSLANSKKSPRFTVIGHTDTSGSDDYNKALSKRRASAVKAELSRLGIASSAIVTDWKGESSPLVTTKDSIKEPQNRRAEVRVEYVK
jgi:outer membrane protein OmpA-like peptidoglycan-associated protein